MAIETTLESIEIILQGYVQGLGVRPAVYRVAQQFGICGSVRNDNSGVIIHAEGPADMLKRFQFALLDALPVSARVDQIDIHPGAVTGESSFRFLQEERVLTPTVPVPVDRAICKDCLRELFDPSNRRFRYPWISCTNCGPRFSIIEAMPYERGQTTYAHFEMCKTCEVEFNDPGDRRFHAQTIACPDCGPQLWTSDPAQSLSFRNEEALQFAAHFIRSGRIVAVRGLGGYQLLADGTNAQAVVELRQRKRRKSKPFAIMVDSATTAERIALVDSTARESLTAPANPIQLLEARPGHGIAPGVSPGLNTLGIMLPMSGLHALLLKEVGRPVVCTSGNLEGEPLQFEVEFAEERLAGICDLWLHHNLPIAHPIDDSVVRTIGGRNVTFRLARGLAPLTFKVSLPAPAFALGAFQKSALAWSTGPYVTLGPHVGDHQTLATRERYDLTRAEMERLYRMPPGVIAHDRHPDYYSTQIARRSGQPSMSVQHHHAHIVAAMVELGWLDEQVLGIAWDGTGFGSDETIWGGEFLLCTVTQFERIGSLRPFRLPGGEAAVQEPWRVAVSLLEQCQPFLDKKSAHHFYEELVAHSGIGMSRLNAVRSLTTKESFAPLTTSAGRLFDAVASILLQVHFSDFDGHPAALLENAAWQQDADEVELKSRDDSSLGHLWHEPTHQLDWRPIIASLLCRRMNGESVSQLALEFHQTLATGVRQFCNRLPDRKIVLGGGVFQNRLLTQCLETQLDTIRLGRTSLVPPNDGGIALGQLVAANYQPTSFDTISRD